MKTLLNRALTTGMFLSLNSFVQLPTKAELKGKGETFLDLRMEARRVNDEDNEGQDAEDRKDREEYIREGRLAEKARLSHCLTHARPPS